ncbi:copper resistance CopC family protein [Bacillus alkalicellulosilyticus]|uniref:copper resistance CopC family protein n=1 Tax=Alkalihalobacterium alkalicellulosilyticum TaxID=1912214 RepID=UPI0014837388|nr:copper resistance protein CopC [Bacillus alkalicellulosilyticus]
MKKSCFFVLLLLFLVPQQAFGHSYVDSSIPGDGDVVDGGVGEIELFFTGGIEEHTTIEVKSEDGEVIELDSEEVDSPQYIASFLEPLGNGEYVVTWKAVAVDGHVTEGEFSFEVTGVEPPPEPEEEPSEEVMVDVDETEEAAEEIEVTEEIEEQTDDQEQSEVVEEEEASTSSSFMPIFFMIIVVVLIVFLIVQFQRRKK